MRGGRVALRTAARVRLLQVLVAATAGTASFVGVALAYSEAYGGYPIGGNNSYIETGGAHTFVHNGGQIFSSPGTIDYTSYIACQLFQKSGTFNQVDHGYGICGASATGSLYTWGRVYNQSGVTEAVAGYANT